MFNQPAIYITDDTVLVQTDDPVFYNDTPANFKNDLDDDFPYRTVDYNQYTSTCIINGIISDYPNIFFDKIIRMKDELIKKQSVRKDNAVRCIQSTYEYKRNELIRQYEADKSVLMQYITEAVAYGDDTDELREELLALDKQFDVDMEALKGDE